MQVIRSSVLGFCDGVSRAVEAVAEESKSVKTSGGQVYILGPLVHNADVLEEIKKSGIEELSKPPETVDDGAIIVRAHGIEPRLEKELREKGVRIVDATCSKVKRNQLKAEELASQGYSLFLAGGHEHAEIRGILGYAELGGPPPFCEVTGSVAEAEKAAAALFEINKDAKTALLGQTTISEDEYEEIADAILKYFPGLEIINTICSATKDRQHALRELLEKVEAVIIAGGKDSANTRRLFAIAQESGKPCVLVENSKGIPESFYKYRTVGLSAGASTPDFVIDEIEQQLMQAS